MTVWRLRMCTRKFRLFNVSPHCGHTTVSLTLRLIGGGGGCEKGIAAVEDGGCEEGAAVEDGGCEEGSAVEDGGCEEGAEAGDW